jgi:hypothetical protein
MASRKKAEPFNLADAMMSALATTDRITRYLIEDFSDEAWRAEPPGGKGRTIAAIAAHIHNVRLMWIKGTARDIPIPAKLDRHTVTRSEAIAAL